ncbi:MAG: hypothetical protein AAFX58_03345 [Pseudomonadota bacterium]
MSETANTLPDAYAYDRASEILVATDRDDVTAAAPVTADTYDLGDLKDSLPGDHRFLMAEYSGILKLALNGAGMSDVEQPARQRLRTLAERLGSLRATPRDLIDMHTAALDRLLRNATRSRVEALSHEARIALLEAVGYLAYYYRRHSVQLPR